LPERAEAALSKKTIVKEWGIKPWEMDRLTAKDLQEIRLAEHASAYIEQEKSQMMNNSGSISHKNYDVSNSRAEAFG